MSIVVPLTSLAAPFCPKSFVNSRDCVTAELQICLYTLCNYVIAESMCTSSYLIADTLLNFNSRYTHKNRNLGFRLYSTLFYEIRGGRTNRFKVICNIVSAAKTSFPLFLHSYGCNIQFKFKNKCFNRDSAWRN